VPVDVGEHGADVLGDERLGVAGVWIAARGALLLLGILGDPKLELSLDGEQSEDVDRLHDKL
jgi:hypothetical protein